MHMLTEEFAEEVDAFCSFVGGCGRVGFAHFSQHPADGFVHQVMGMIQEHVGVAERMLW